MAQNSQQNRAFDEQMKSKHLIKKFGAGQIFLAIICTILGSVGTVLINKNNMYARKIYDNSSLPITGSGIWSPFFTMIAGGIGIRVGRRRSSKVLMRVHKVLTKIGCVFELFGFILSAIVFSKVDSEPILIKLVYMALCILSTINFSFLVSTLVLYRKLRKSSRSSATDSEHQMTYVPPNYGSNSSWYDDDAAASRNSYDAATSWGYHDAAASRNSFETATSGFSTSVLPTTY